MKDPYDTRDSAPRAGSPLWIHMALVVFTGAGALAWAVGQTGAGSVHGLVRSPVFWEIAALTVAGEMRPIVTPGRPARDAPVISLTFSFTALLFWGFGVAALLRVLSTVIAGVAQHRAPHRIAFNAAQLTLSLGAAGLVLMAGGLHPSPAAPGAPTGRELPYLAAAAAAYFVLSYLLVSIAVALHSRTSYPRTVRTSLPYQAFVNFVLLSAAPLVAIAVSRSPRLLRLFLLPQRPADRDRDQRRGGQQHEVHERLVGQ